MDTEDLLRMKPHEIKRLHLIQQALDKKISQKPAAEVAGLSPRQMQRLMKRGDQEGGWGHSAPPTGKALEPADCGQDQAESVGVV